MSAPGQMADLWDKASRNPGEKVPIGRVVVCDVCNHDYTERPECGGFIFGSNNAYCPTCAEKHEPIIKSYGEEHYIRARCPDEQSFADFVRAYRGPDSFIRISKGKP